MDVVTQIIAGLLIGTVVAGFVMCRPAQRFKIVLAGGLGGIFPEVDTLSLMPWFDRTLGKWMGINQSGIDIYFGNEWFSHQAFTHSLLGLLCCTGAIWFLNILFYTHVIKHARTWKAAGSYLAPYFIAFAGGYLLHLMLDLFTPAGPWGGIRLFFPMDVYIGGWGKLWWWNNYDIILVLFLGLMMNVLSLISIPIMDRKMKIIPSMVLALALIGISIQIHSRHFNFNQPGYMGREAASHHIQQQVLAPPVYEAMAWVDQRLPVYF